jgi:hypothetical protein
VEKSISVLTQQNVSDPRELYVLQWLLQLLELNYFSTLSASYEFLYALEVNYRTLHNVFDALDEVFMDEKASLFDDI